MSAARHCLHAALVACQERAPAVLAVVMGSEGSTYAGAGAIALFGADGAQHGWLSGGCLEPEIARCAARAAAAGEVAWMEIDTRDDADLLSGSAVGCRGRLHLALLPLPALPGFARLAQAWLQRRGGLSLALDGDGGIVAAVADATLQWRLPCRAWEGATACAGQVRIPPPPRVSVFGAGPETATLVPLLRQLGWMTTLVEQRPRWVAQAALADQALACMPARALAACADSDAALVMHHHFELDREALEALAASAIPFVGLLGPARRREDLFRLLRPQQQAQLRPRLHAPIGLRLGGSGAEAIALSIAAQLQATRAAPAQLHAVPPLRGATPCADAEARAMATPVPLQAGGWAMNATHAALILAAGGSRRLGQLKQALTRDGEPLLRRTVRLALATAPARCVVVLGAHDAALRPLLDGLPVELVRNPHWSAGMGGSLACLRAAVQGDAALSHSLILGCDQPALEAAHLQDLLAAAGRAASGCAVSGYAGIRGMPVVVAQPRWRALRLQGDQGLRALFDAMAPDSLGCIVAPALALDVDTPQDLLAAVERGWLDP